MATAAMIICQVCGSMDIIKKEIVIDGVTQEWSECADCGFEWPQEPSQTLAIDDES